MKKILLICGVPALLIAAVLAAISYMCGADASCQEQSHVAVEQKCAKQILANSPAKPKIKSRLDVPQVKPVIEVEDEELPPAEKALLERIEQATDAEKLETLRQLLSEVKDCGNAEIRRAMVDALGFFGAKALSELTLFLSDVDEDVRDSARNEWSSAVSEVEDEGQKLGAVEVVMSIIGDEDFLEDISSEYIGVDEKLAVESLLRVIESEGSKGGIAKAKETYEFVTGEEFTNRAAAEKWIAEEYTPPEE